MEVSEYHFNFDLNGVLLVTRKGPIKNHPMVLKLGFTTINHGFFKGSNY
jgi:hypothetical protein